MKGLKATWRLESSFRLEVYLFAVLIPVGLWIVIKLIPEPVMAECRLRADALPTRPVSGSAAIVIVGLWVGVAALAAWPLFSSRP